MTEAQVYAAIAEELSAPGAKLTDLDEEMVAVAHHYAKRTHKKWPPRPQTSGWQVTVQTYREDG